MTYTFYSIKVNGKVLEDEHGKIKESGHGAKSRIIKIAKELDQNQHIEVIWYKYRDTMLDIAYCIDKKIIWENN